MRGARNIKLKVPIDKQNQTPKDHLVHLLPNAELLNGEIFYTLKEAQVLIESWRCHYNVDPPTWQPRIPAAGPGDDRHAKLAARLRYAPPATQLGRETRNALTFNLDQSTGAGQFSTVNLAQTKVNKSSVYDLFSLEKTRSPERTCHEVAVAMDKLPESPFFERIKRLGTTTEGRIDETLSQATFVRGLLPFITNDPVTDRDMGKRFGFWDPAPARRERQQFLRPYFTANKDERILAIMMNYFSAVSECWPRAWAGAIDGGMLNKTNGYNALMRFLREVYHEISPGKLEIVDRETFLKCLGRLNVGEETLTVENYRPGSSGASALYRRLVEELERSAEE